MLDQASGDDLLKATVYDTDGNKIGRVGRVYLDDASGHPEWVTVQTGLFGTKETFMPLGQGRLDGDRLVVPIAKDAVKDAPHIDPDSGHLSVEEEQRLYQHYGLSHGDETDDVDSDGLGLVSPGVVPAAGGDGEQQHREQARTEQPGTGQPGTGRPGTEQAALRLRRHVVTGQQQISVPVTREEYVVEGGEQDQRNDRTDGPKADPNAPPGAPR